MAAAQSIKTTRTIPSSSVQFEIEYLQRQINPQYSQLQFYLALQLSLMFLQIHAQMQFYFLRIKFCNVNVFW